MTEKLRELGAPAAWWLAITFAALVLGMASATRPTVALALVALLAASALVLSRQGLLLAPLTLIVLAWGSSRLPLQGLAYPAKFAMFGVIAAVAVAHAVHPRRHLPVPVGFAAAFAVLLLFAGLTVTWSLDPSLSFQRTMSMFLLWGAVCVGMPLSLTSPADVRLLYYRSALVLGGVTVAGLVLGGAGIVTGFQADGRFHGILVNANTLGYFAAPILPAAVLLAAQMDAGRRRRLLVAAASVTAIGIAISGSRGGAISVLLGVVAGLVVATLGARTRQVRRTIVLAGVLLATAAAAFPLLGFEARVGGAGTEGYFEIGTGSHRTISWADTLPAISAHPILGQGFGMMPVVFPTIQTGPTTTQLGGVHNGYLEVALEMGFPGAIGVFLLAGSGAVVAIRLSRRPGPTQDLGPMLLAAIVAGLAESTIESGILSAGGLFAFPFWLAVALAHSVWAYQRQSAR